MSCVISRHVTTVYTSRSLNLWPPDIASALETDDNRSATNCPDIIKISAGYLFTKLHAIEASFLTGPRMWSRQYFDGKWTQSKSGPCTAALCLLPAHKINDKACIQLRLSSRSGTLTATPGAKTILLLCHYEPQLHKRHIQVTWVHVNIPLNEGTNERVFLLLPDSI